MPAMDQAPGTKNYMHDSCKVQKRESYVLLCLGREGGSGYTIYIYLPYAKPFSQHLIGINAFSPHPNIPLKGASPCLFGR